MWFSRGFSDSDIVHSYAKRSRRKSAILLAQIALSFHNKGPSIRAKNNDPLEVFVFTSLFERLSWLGRGVQTSRRGGEENPVQGRNTTVNVDKIRGFRPPYVWAKTFVLLLTLDRESTDRCFLYACYGNPVYNGHLFLPPFAWRKKTQQHQECRRDGLVGPWRSRASALETHNPAEGLR